jgi:iron complex transport system substrate-binding protein
LLQQNASVPSVPGRFAIPPPWVFPQRLCFSSFSHRGTVEHRGSEVLPLDQITGAIIGASIRIHQKLGPGLLESVYEIILARDLTRAGFHIERQTAITFEFEGTLFHEGFRPDLIVNGSVVVEVKAAEATNPICARQVLTYMKILKLKRGLVMNFGMTTMRAGIERVIL